MIGIFALPKIDNTIQSLEKKVALEVLSKITLLSQSTMKDLETYKINSLNRHKDELKQKSNIVWNYIDAKYNQIGKKGTSQELKDEVIKMIVKMGDEKKKRNFSLIDYNSVIIAHIYAQGIDASKNTDIKGNYSINDMVEIALTKGEGFLSFWYYRAYESKDKSCEKLSYIRNFPKWNMLLATGVFINEIDETLKKRKAELFLQLKSIIKNTKIAKTGYIYIFDKNGKIIVHPNDTLIGKSLSDKELSEKLIKISKTTKELIYKNNKIYWIEYLPSLDLYIVASVNNTEIKKSSNTLQNKIKYIGLFILFLSIIISVIFFRKLLKPILSLSNMVNLAIKGDYTVRSKNNSTDEIGILSKDFNTMIGTIEDHIENNRHKDKLLFQQSKLASMGEMLGNIAHQWRQPINRVNLSLEVIDSILEDDDIDKKFIKKKIESSQTNIAYMSQTIEDFTDFFNPNKNMQDCNIVNTINKTIKLLAERLSNIEVKINSNKKIIFKTFENELIQVLLIVLNNAIDNFNSKNILNPKININISINDKNLILEIIDNGLGIKKENCDKIFEPYFTTKFKNEGTGLGLYMAKMLVEESMHGKIDIISDKIGATFTIKL